MQICQLTGAEADRVEHSAFVPDCHFHGHLSKSDAHQLAADGKVKNLKQGALGIYEGYSGSGDSSPNSESGAGIAWRGAGCVFLACADGRTSGAGPGSSRYQECLTPLTLLCTVDNA